MSLGSHKAKGGFQSKSQQDSLQQQESPKHPPHNTVWGRRLMHVSSHRTCWSFVRATVSCVAVVSLSTCTPPLDLPGPLPAPPPTHTAGSSRSSCSATRCCCRPS